MRRFLTLITVICLATLSFAQQTNKISIHAMVVDDIIPKEATKNLETKMLRMLLANDIIDNGADRFVFTARVNILNKDITPTAPIYISEKMEITFLVGDIVDNKLYESFTIELSGIGTTEDKAFISAFQQINANNIEIKTMLKRAQSKIIDYYSIHCDDILTKANTLSAHQKYDEAIFNLMNIPDVCSECYERCQTTAADIYDKKLTFEGKVLLNNARNEWLAGLDIEAANRAINILAQINPQSSVYPEVQKLQNTISSKLQADALQVWQLKMKAIEEEQKIKLQAIEERNKTARGIIDCIKSIGVAWANNQPTSVVRNIVRKW